MTEQKKNKNLSEQVKIFTVPFDLVDLEKNENNFTKKTSTSCSKKILLQAIDNQQKGNITKASALYKQLIDQGLKDHRVFFNYANLLKTHGRLEESETFFRMTIDLKPQYISAYCNLIAILLETKRLKEAENLTKKAIKIKSSVPELYCNLGLIMKESGRLNEAELFLRKAIKINPNSSLFHMNLGVVLENIGKLKEAEISFERAIKIKPDYPEAYANLGTILNSLFRQKEGEKYLRKAIKINPYYAEAYYNLSRLLIEQGRLEEAEQSIRKAIELKSDFVDAYSNLGIILKDLGKFEEAKECFIKCIELDPNDLAFNIQARLFISKIPFDQIQIEKEREELNRQISFIGNNNNIIFKNQRIPNSIDFIFYLAYHNCNNDQEILTNIANNLSKKQGIINRSFNIDERIKQSSARKKIRLGICSNFLFSHSVTRCYMNVIKDIAKTGIDVFIFRGNNDKEDHVSKQIDSFAKETFKLPNSHEESCQLVLNKSIDILLYLDIGMSMKTYLMSLSRLALVQVLHCGHPNTSGSPNMDYFITSKYKETEDSDMFFTERLIRLNRIGNNYDLPVTQNSNFNFSSLNFSVNDFIIGLPHTVFKYHPDFDKLLANILEAIPNAYLFVFEGLKQHETESLLSRWKKNIKYNKDRIRLYPRVTFDDYISIIRNFDIVLDPLYCGMGNTFYQAMAYGIPAVSMLTNKSKGRFVYAGYRQMGITNPPIVNTKSEYVAICKKLAFDNEYRKNISDQIKSKAKDKLFNDKNIYKQYVQFFNKSLEAAQKKELLPLKWSPSID